MQRIKTKQDQGTGARARDWPQYVDLCAHATRQVAAPILFGDGAGTVDARDDLHRMLHHRKFERRAQAVRYDGDAVDRVTKGEYVVGSGLGEEESWAPAG